MTDRDWESEMRKIDRQIASLPSEAAAPDKAPAPGGRATPQGTPQRTPQGTPPATSTFGVMARLALACALGVAIVFWPYGARCGFGLAGYLGAVAVLITAGVWSSVWTWKHRAARAHTVALLLVSWGLLLAGVDILPRVGYAKATLQHPAHWTCP
jgi:hypothetical protein